MAKKTTKTTKRNTSKRKTSGNRTRKRIGVYSIVRRIVLAAIAVTAILVAAVSYMLLKITVNPAHSGKDIDGSYTYMFSEYPFLKRWTDSLKINNALKDTTIYAADGTRLHALYAKAPRKTKKTAVIVHGYTDNAVRMLHIGYLYNHDLGYNILLPDLRNSGKSEGTHIQMGWNDRLDVMRWMNIADSIFGGNTKMVVHGISLGGAATMMIAGEKQPPYVKAYVEDCGYTSVWDELKHEINQDYGLPDMPFLYIADLFCQLEYDWGFKEASAIEQIKKCDTPMLFIHGGADTFVPTEMVYRLYQAKPRNKEIWVLPGVMHARSYHDKRKEYTETVRDFLSMYIY